jgi:succinoglycan biosynthesis protein ExoA
VAIPAQRAPGSAELQSKKPFVSVCVVTGKRPQSLGVLLQSLTDQVDPPPFEVLVCGTCDSDLATQVRAVFPEAKVGLALSARPGGGRNHLLPAARGEWMYFLDDDVVVDRHALRRLSELASIHPDIGVFGGPNATPPGSDAFQRTQGAVLGSLAGSGPVRRRYTTHPSARARERDLILCNLAVKRENMIPFDASLTCAEENGLLAQLARSGIKMRYEPGLSLYHERRPDLRSFARQIHKYGRGRGEVIVRNARTVRAPYFLPLALLAYLALLPLLAWLSLWALVPLAMYLVWVAAGALKVAISCKGRRMSAFALSVVLLVVIHGAYGIGLVTGLWRRPSAPAGDFLWLDAALAGTAEAGVPHVT